jgi:hypothetical protein
MNNNANADGGTPSNRSEGKSERFLSAEHQRMLLEESGIEPEIVETRGYRTVRRKVELENLGFRRKQRIVPALLAPVYSPTGEISTYQIRPDQPRIDSEGDPVKYETPWDSQMRFDVHPFMHDKLGDPSRSGSPKG